MKLFILNLLSLIPYRTKWGLSIDSYLKDTYWKKIGRKINGSIYLGKKRCLCGGLMKINQWNGGYEIICSKCGFLLEED